MSDIKKGDRVWTTDGSSGTVNKIYYAPPAERGLALSHVPMATVVWDRTGCPGDIELSNLSKIEVKHHVHFTDRDAFLALVSPRGVAEALVEKDPLTVWVVLAAEQDHAIRHAAEAVSMSAEYSERYQGWIIQL